MGWLSNFMQQREIDRLTELLRSAPAPSVYLRLSQMHEDNGDMQKATDLALKGAENFLENEQLQDARKRVERFKHAAQKDRLKARIEQFPNPSVYGKLASLYLEEGDLEECHNTCNRSLKAYPEYGGTHLILAQLALREGDHDTALSELQQTVEQDQYNYAALMLLTEEHLRRSEKEEARKALESIKTFAPNDERAAEMLADFDNIARQYMEDAKSETPTRRLSLQDIAQLDHDGSDTPGNMEAGAALDQLLGELTAIEGVEGCALLDTHGLVVASCMEKSHDEDLISALLTNIHRASQTATEPLGLGAFHESILESSTGRIYLMQLEEVLLACLTASNAKAGMVQRSLDNFAHKLKAAQS